MKFDDYARDAGNALAAAGRDIELPSVAEMAARRRRTGFVWAGAAVLVLAIVAVSLAGAISEPELVPPADTPASTTSVEMSAPPLIVDLLDGTQLEVEGAFDFSLSDYFFFLEVPELGGEKNVDVSRTIDPSADGDLCAELGDGVQLWCADREGQPIFMSIDLGGWLVYLHVGWGTPPDSDFLTALADELRGEVTDNGVIMPGANLEVFRTYLGWQDGEGSIDIDTGQCLREMVPGAEVVSHPRRGHVIRADRYASWCDPENDLEVRLYVPEDLVERLLDDLTLGRTERLSQPTSTTIAATPTTTRFTSEAWELVADHPVVGRTGPVVVWTGNEVVVWAGEKPPHQGAWHSDGAAWDPESGTWRELADSPLSPRSGHVAVWTGSEILVCCGRIEGGGAAAGAYDPAADQWRVIASPPISPSSAEAVWTGEEMIVFGGVLHAFGAPLSDAFSYDPDTDTWTELAELPHPIERSADSVFAGGLIYVWPSWRPFDLENPPGPLAYNVETDEWNPLPEPPAEAPAIASVVWTGLQLFAYGAHHTDDGAIGVGVLFDPNNGSWSVAESAPLDPTDWWEGTDGSEAAVWGDDRVYIWTGYVGTEWDEPFTNVVTYDPNANAWELLGPAPIPAQGLYQSPIIWTGTELITYSNPMVVFDP